MYEKYRTGRQRLTSITEWLASTLAKSRTDSEAKLSALGDSSRRRG
jgi:hypothetical protein